MVRIFFKSFILLFTFCFLEASEEILISKGVARVGESFVTTRDVQISFAIRELLESSQRSQKEIPAEGSAFTKHLLQLLLEQMIFFESHNIKDFSIKKEEIKQAERKIKKRKKRSPVFKRLNITSEEISKEVTRFLTSRKFLVFKFQRSLFNPSDQQMRAHYEKHKKNFQGKSFSEARKMIQLTIQEQERAHKMKSWFDILKEKYNMALLET